MNQIRACVRIFPSHAKKEKLKARVAAVAIIRFLSHDSNLQSDSSYVHVREFAAATSGGRCIFNIPRLLDASERRPNERPKTTYVTSLASTRRDGKENIAADVAISSIRRIRLDVINIRIGVVTYLKRGLILLAPLRLPYKTRSHISRPISVLFLRLLQHPSNSPDRQTRTRTAPIHDIRCVYVV